MPPAEAVSRQARAVLHHPDQRSAWVVVVAATVDRVSDQLDQRLATVADATPVTAARLRAHRWTPGAPAAVIVTTGDPLEDPRLVARFDLRHDPPVRVLVDAARTRIAVAVHHAALDGRGVVALLATLLGGTIPEPVSRASPPAARARSGRSRGFRRADRVAASSSGPVREILLVRELEIAGSDVTARLAAACASAARSHNARSGASWGWVGISVGAGGPPGIGNVASYRRVDVEVTADVAGAVRAALADPIEPAELRTAPRLGRLLAPVVEWFSDSFLVSNLGRLEVPGARRIEFFPVARGRSAVSFGAAGLGGGPSTLSVRARDLSRDDAARLLDGAVRAFVAPSEP
jgi:hypothetical protein